MDHGAGLPLYLSSPADFRVFLAEQFEGLTTVQKVLGLRSHLSPLLDRRSGPFAFPTSG
jgi:hypothetical protein